VPLRVRQRIRVVKVVGTPASMRSWSDEQRLLGARVALVPTMGALHEGHVALIREARRHADAVVVSIFVNPLQFDVRADFDRYPRVVDDDLAACAAAGAHAVYAPSAEAMYPPGFQTHVEPGRLADGLEGEHRPGHFRGVATVVAKLFGAVRPDVAVFGEKDFQQLAVVRRMARDLDTGIEIVGVATVREEDGLALSSRNRRLGREDRAAATCIVRGLRAAAARHRAGERRAASLVEAVAAEIRAEPRARLEYVELVDPDSLSALAGEVDGGVLVVAAWFGDVRLIDNLPLVSSTPTR